jgi:hypothetical protein
LSQKETKDSVCFFVRNNISINDEEPWQIVLSDSCKIQKFNFQLFNRWGTILFEAKSIEEANSFNPFNSQKNSKNTFETGTYYWKVRYSIFGNRKELNQEGILYILR